MIDTKSNLPAQPTAHTPTPWKGVCRQASAGKWLDTFIETEETNQLPRFQRVAQVWDKNGVPGETVRANAALIVRAVNCHAELVAGVKILGEIATLVESFSGGGAEIGKIRELIRTAKAKSAIARAEGGAS